jgi:hypothetical protein
LLMTTPGEEQPRPQPEHGVNQDPTLGAINDVTETLGGTATGAAAEVELSTMPATLEGRLLEGMLNGPPSESLRRHVRAQRRKAYMLHQFIEDGAVPANPLSANALDNAIEFSQRAQSPEMDQVLEEVRTYLFRSGEVDVFEMQHHADRLVQTLVGNASKIDMAELVLLCRQTIQLENDMLTGVSDAALRRSGQQIRQFDHAVVASVVQTVDAQELLGDGIIPTHEMHQRVFGSEAEDTEHSRLTDAQRVIRDRLWS